MDEANDTVDSANTRVKMRWWSQFAGALSVSMASISLGTVLGFTVRALPQLEEAGSNDSEHLTTSQGSWFAATTQLTSILFSPLGGALSNWCGRRRLMLIVGPFVIGGWLFIAMAQNLPMLFMGRVLTSLCYSLIYPSVGVYITETSAPVLRGSLSVFPGLFLGTGNLLVWTVGYFLDWRDTSFICVVPPTLMMLAMFLLPESPYWLVEAGNVNEAKRSLQFYRGQFYDVQAELTEIQEKHTKKLELKRSGQNGGWKWTLKRLASKAFLKPYMCVGMLSNLNSWIGIDIILNYMVTLFQQAKSSVDPELAPIIIGCVRIVSATLSSLLMFRMSRKVLYIGCIFITGLANLSIATYAYLHTMHQEASFTERFGWIPIVAVVTIMLVRSLGALPVTDTLLAEVYPTDIRTLAIGITQAGFLASSSGSIRLYPVMVEGLQFYGTFYLYAGVAFFMAIWGLTIPDNRGKSLIQVEEDYERMN